MANGYSSHAEGCLTIASSDYQHVEGQYNIEDTDGVYVHIVGWGTDDANRRNIHTIDTSGNAAFSGKVTIGDESGIPDPTDDGDLITKKYFDENASSDGGVGQISLDGEYSEIFNDYVNNVASGQYSHAEGYITTAAGDQSHAEGGYSCANGIATHAEGQETKASGFCSHAEGYGSEATEDADYAHAEGKYTVASKAAAHAEGSETTAAGDNSHAEGYNTIASGNASHSEGWGTKASSDYQHVEGKYNVEDASDTYAHIVGWGTSDTARKNIHTIDTNGNAVFAGTCTATSHPTTSSKRFKENFREVPSDEIRNIFNLETKKFDYKKEYGGKKDKVGFIAEDVEPIFPNCVSYDPKGVITGIDYSSFVPYIIEIIKQQAAEIEELKSMIVS